MRQTVNPVEILDNGRLVEAHLCRHGIIFRLRVGFISIWVQYLIHRIPRRHDPKRKGNDADPDEHRQKHQHFFQDVL